MYFIIYTLLGKSHIVKETALAFLDGEYFHVCMLMLLDECLCLFPFLLGLLINEVFPVLGSPTTIMLIS